MCENGNGIGRATVRIKAHEVHNGVVHRCCPGPCGGLKPLNDFGLRRMKGRGEDGADLITNQSWCRECRAGAKRA